MASLLGDPRYRTAFATSPAWQPRSLAQRSRDARFAPPEGLPPPPAAAPGLPPPGMPPPTMPAAPGLPRGMPPAPAPAAGGMPPMTFPGAPAPVSALPAGAPPALETPERATARLNAVPMQRSGPFFDGPVPGMQNVDRRLLPPPATLTALLTAPQRFRAPGAEAPPLYAPVQGVDARGLPTLTQSPASLAAAANRPPPDAAAFASEAARRAVVEGSDPIAARKAAEAVLPGGKASRVGQTREIDGVTYVYTQEGNLSPLAKEKPDAPVTRSIEVGGRKFTIGPGDKYFDEQGKPVDFTREKPMSAMAWVNAGLNPDDYLAYVDKFNQATGGAAAVAAPAAPEAAAGARRTVTTKEEFDALKKGERFIFNGKAGTKK